VLELYQMSRSFFFGGAALALLVACGEDPVSSSGVPLLGNGTHSVDSVSYGLVTRPEHELDVPRDLAFCPERPTELWIANYGSSSVSIVHLDSGHALDVDGHGAAGHEHFLEQPSAIAFGAPGTMATAQDTDEVTQSFTPADFMGPTLWSTDPLLFDGGHASHLDMLHNSPNSAGIAWERDNAYWLFDGAHGSLTRYDFREDHGPGGEDHSDGIIARYVAGQVRYEPGVSSHLVYDDGLLYVADTGNNRIAVLDTASGTRGSALSPNYDGAEQYSMNGASLWTLVDGAAVGLVKPSGLELRDGVLYVSDNATAKIYAFSLAGELLDWLDVPRDAGALMGMAFDGAGSLYFADAVAGLVFRVAAR
jgi:hypothetical protein